LGIGRLAPGSARFIWGSTAIASASRAGPRRNGMVTLEARNGLAADATSIRPSSLRIAHAHEVGPCTSTPFGRAIPPNRIFSSGMAAPPPAKPARPLLGELRRAYAHHAPSGYPAATRSARCRADAAGPGDPPPTGRPSPAIT